MRDQAASRTLPPMTSGIEIVRRYPTDPDVPTEDEIERTVPNLETGAPPPVPGLLALPEVFDRGLGAALVGDICE
jgi:hypothetical protein